MRVSGRNFLRRAVLVFIAIPIVTTTAQSPPLRFTKPRPYNWAGGYSVAAADLNRDGHLDLVALNGYPRKVGVLLGNGDGTFKRVVEYLPGSSNASSLAIADVNGDRKPDIVVGPLGPYNAGVLLGNGDGSFHSAVTYNVGDDAYGLAVGDLNSDGYPDVAVAGGVCGWEEGCVNVLYNDGHGRFGTPMEYPTGGYGTTRAVAIADGSFIATNGCLDPEYYCTWPPGTVCWNVYCYESGGGLPVAIATGDLNGDGYFDVVVTHFDDRSGVGVLLGDGYNGFRNVVTYRPPDWAWGAWDVAVGDVNGDGKPDIVVSPLGPYNAGVLLGNGDGTFQSVVYFGWVGDILDLGDVNGDGKLDVIGTDGILLNTSGFITTTHITSLLNPSFVNQTVTFTATVRSQHGLIPDGELVKFYTGTKLLASIPLSGGTATYTTSTLTAETHIMKAKYAGDTTYAPSTGQIQQVVQ